MVGQALDPLRGWMCESTADCDEDAVLYIYLFPDERPLQHAEGTALCMRHFNKAMHDAVLELTDDNPELHHVIVSRP